MLNLFLLQTVKYQNSFLKIQRNNSTNRIHRREGMLNTGSKSVSGQECEEPWNKHGCQLRTLRNETRNMMKYTVAEWRHERYKCLY